LELGPGKVLDVRQSDDGCARLQGGVQGAAPIDRAGAGAAALTEIKSPGQEPVMLRLSRRSKTMPLESALIVAAILIAFCIFAVTLAWTDFRTRRISGH
jgi:multisubunit Na+/H+ antiporter MnhC subunit